MKLIKQFFDQVMNFPSSGYENVIDKVSKRYENNSHDIQKVFVEAGIIFD